MHLRTAALAILLIVLLPMASLAVSYRRVNLGTLGGSYSYAYAVNNRGQVVGYSSALFADGTSGSHAFIWDSVNGMRDLGTLGGKYSFAFDINEAGQVVGGASLSDGTQCAFIWDEVNGMQSIGRLDGGKTATAYGISDNGVVVGSSIVRYIVGSMGVIDGFIWDAAGGMRDAGFNGSLEQINDSGVAIGYGASGGFTWTESGKITSILPPDSTSGSLADINNAGQVVGTRNIGDEKNSFLWDPVDGFTIIPTFGTTSTVSALNSTGTVAGFSRDADGRAHGFVWDRATGMTDLGPECSASEINDLGWVVGNSGYYDQRATLWMPVPEPSSIGVILAGLSGCRLFLRRRRR